MTANKIKISAGRIVDPYNKVDQVGDIFIENGEIVHTSTSSAEFDEKSFSAELTIDAKGLVVSPSLVDLSVHLREPGFEKKATIESELKAAVSAGVGHVACMPSCKPTIDSKAVASLILDKANDLGLAKVYPIGALTAGLNGSQLSEMKSLLESGCPALTNLYNKFDSLNVLRNCYDYAASFDIPVFIFPQVNDLAKGACAHEGKFATSLGLTGIPETAETIAISTHLLLVEQTGVRAHFSHISSARGLDLIEDAQQSGLSVTADVAMHQIHLNDSSLVSYDSLFHLQPPLRSEEDQNRLREGLVKGSISAICSSHQPHEAAAKFQPFASSEVGISALETLLPLAGELQKESTMSLLDLLARLTSGPASILGLDQTGIALGNKADLCIFSTDGNWQLSEENMLSAGKNSPFLSQPFNFQNHYTFVDGNLVYRKN